MVSPHCFIKFDASWLIYIIKFSNVCAMDKVIVFTPDITFLLYTFNSCKVNTRLLKIVI